MRYKIVCSSKYSLISSVVNRRILKLLMVGLLFALKRKRIKYTDTVILSQVTICSLRYYYGAVKCYFKFENNTLKYTLLLFELMVSFIIE